MRKCISRRRSGWQITGRRCRRIRRFTVVYGGRRYLAVQSAGKPGRAGGAHFVSESNAGYRHGEHLWSTDLNKTTMTGYVGPALVLKAGGLLHIPFGILYKLGRLGNLYVYAAVLYFAIKNTGRQGNPGISGADA